MYQTFSGKRLNELSQTFIEDKNMQYSKINQELQQKKTSVLEKIAHTFYTTDYGHRKQPENIAYQVIMYLVCLYVAINSAAGWAFYVENATTSLDKDVIYYISYPIAFAVQFFILFFADITIRDYFGLVPSSNNPQTINGQSSLLSYYGFTRINYSALFFLLVFLVSNICAMSIGTQQVKAVKIDESTKELQKYDSTSNVLLAFASKEDKKHKNNYSLNVEENMKAYANVNMANELALKAQAQKIEEEKNIKKQLNVMSWINFGLQSFLDFVSIICKILINRYQFFKTRHLQDLILELDEVKRKTERQVQENILNSKKQHLQVLSQDLSNKTYSSLESVENKEVAVQNNTYNVVVAPAINKHQKNFKNLEDFKNKKPKKFKEVCEKFVFSGEQDLREISAKRNYSDGEGLENKYAHAFLYWINLRAAGKDDFDVLASDIPEQDLKNNLFAVI